MFRSLKRWTLKGLLALDKVGNVLTGGKKWETISSRMGKVMVDPNASWWAKGISKGLCGALDVIDKNHCVESIERERVQLARVILEMALEHEKLKAIRESRSSKS